MHKNESEIEMNLERKNLGAQYKQWELIIVLVNSIYTYPPPSVCKKKQRRKGKQKFQSVSKDYITPSKVRCLMKLNWSVHIIIKISKKKKSVVVNRTTLII